ncbi:hypothetical protein LAZ67_X003556 [Cordylochernes scorpioides]|uniref:Uncharacterized protein n=1 Tax=Cordylochernes scorpioides TaxID=51811 RepID=A0ABY6LWT8_9ARAC|nr:hypothetical protein LAZ67_X003556 [Cordylochernes scorpioides]
MQVSGCYGFGDNPNEGHHSEEGKKPVQIEKRERAKMEEQPASPTKRSSNLPANKRLYIRSKLSTLQRHSRKSRKISRFPLCLDHDCLYSVKTVKGLPKCREDYFIGKRNVIYERAKFNRRSQGETEPVEEFITDLYVLAETCSYGSLREEMIRDRLVVGVKNLNLSEKLQLESELTLEKAIQIVRQSESVKNQQKEIRQDTEDRNVDVIDRKGSRNGTNVRKTRMKGVKDCEAKPKGDGLKDSDAKPKDEGMKDSEEEPKGDVVKDSEAKPKGAGVRELPPLEVNDRVWLTDLNGEPYVNYPEANPHTSDAATDVTDSSTSPGRTVRPPRRFGED